MFLSVFFALFIIGIVNLRIVIGSYYQILGGQELEKVLSQSAFDGSISNYCQPPISDSDTIQLASSVSSLLEKSLSYNPNSSHTHLLLGRSYCLQQNFEKAIEHYSTYTLERPESPLGFLELGFALEAECRSLANRVEDPTEPSFIDSLPCSEPTIQAAMNESWIHSGVAYQNFLDAGNEMKQEGKFLDAMEWYARGRILGANIESELWYTQHLFLKDRGREDASFSALEEAIKLDDGWYGEESRFIAWYQRGVRLYNLTQYQSAETSLERVVSLFPNKAHLRPVLSEAYRYLGLAQWEQGNLASAESNMELAVELNPENLWAHIHYGKVLYLSNPEEVQRVKDQFEQALELEYDDANIILNLIDFWDWVGETDEFQELCNVALLEQPSEPHLMDRCNP